jgi:hypothetical protein
VPQTVTVDWKKLVCDNLDRLLFLWRERSAYPYQVIGRIR